MTWMSEETFLPLKILRPDEQDQLVGMAKNQSNNKVYLKAQKKWQNVDCVS